MSETQEPYTTMPDFTNSVIKAIMEVKGSEQGFGEVRIIIKGREVTRLIVTLDTKV